MNVRSISSVNFTDVVNAASGALLAQEMVSAAITDYRFMRSRAKDDNTVKLKCHMSGQEFEPVRIGHKGGCITIIARKANGSECKMFAPVTNVTFEIVLEKPIPPDKEMGYAAIIKQMEDKMETIEQGDP